MRWQNHSSAAVVALPGIVLNTYDGARRLPHYGHWAAAIGLTVIAVIIISMLIATLLRGRRRR
ncbi:hypothetical protein AB0L06_18005 [Spirillospora sp. NPDC052269]